MIKYTKREMPDLDKDGKNKAYYKAECIGHIGPDEFIDHISKLGVGMPKGIVKAVLAQITSTASYLMSLGYNVSIEGLGQLSLKIGPKKGREVEGLEADSTRRNATSLRVTGVNFRVDKDFLKELNRVCDMERGGDKLLKKSPYTREQRLEILKNFLRKENFIDIQTYTSLTGLSRSTAYRELERFANDEVSGIDVWGRRGSKRYILKKTDNNQPAAEHTSQPQATN